MSIPALEELRRKGQVTFRSLKESTSGNLESWVDSSVDPGDSVYTDVADELASRVLAALSNNKSIEDKGGLVYRWAEKSDWDDPAIASTWAEVQGDKMVVIEKGDKRDILFDSPFDLSEFIEKRLVKLFGKDGDPDKARDTFIKEDRISESFRSRGKSMSNKLLEAKQRERLRAIREKRRLAEAKRRKPVEKVTESQIRSAALKAIRETAKKLHLQKSYSRNPFLNEAYGDTNPTALLIWFPSFLKQQLSQVDATCVCISDSWDEFGDKDQGKIYTSSYKIRPKFGGNLLLDVAIIDNDETWEAEVDLEYEGGNWDQVTQKIGSKNDLKVDYGMLRQVDKHGDMQFSVDDDREAKDMDNIFTRDNIKEAPKDRLRQLLGEIISQVKEVCKKRMTPTKKGGKPWNTPAPGGVRKAASESFRGRRSRPKKMPIRKVVEALIQKGHKPTKIPVRGIYDKN